METALSISLLLAFVVGIMEGSLALYSYHFISNAAREGVRYAIVRGSTWGTPCTTYSSAGCTASKKNIQDYVASLAFPGINPDPTKLIVNPAWYSTFGGTSDPAYNTPKNVVQVQVQYTFPLRVPFVPQAAWTMSSQSEMEISQ
ncbi:MAG TPA: TadE family protein [Bryobacteraceae bacterium]